MEWKVSPELSLVLEEYYSRLEKRLEEWMDLHQLMVQQCLRNALFLGVYTQWAAEHPTRDPPLGFIVLEFVFTFVFVFELMLRLLAFGTQFFMFSMPNFYWNIFDLVIVMSGILETIFSVQNLMDKESDGNSGLSSLRVVRVVRVTRLGRVLRVIRVANFIRALRDLVMSIMYTIRAAVWSLILLCMIIYVFGILFTQAVITETSTNDEVTSAAQENFGSLILTTYTLYLSITSGIDWGDAVQPLWNIGVGWGIVFVMYQAFCFFAVLNVVTSVFCQAAIASGLADLDTMIMNESRKREQFIVGIEKLFQVLDSDEDGKISEAEFTSWFTEECIRAYFAALELETSNPKAFFRLLDRDGTGEITIETFVQGCLALSGNAKKLELAGLSRRTKDMQDVLEKELGHLKSRSPMRFAVI